MSYNSIKKGNLLLYVGVLKEHYNKVAQVLSIDKSFDGKDSFLLKLTDLKKQELEIRAYANEVWPITLDVIHLNKLGFIQGEKINVFTLQNLILIRPIFVSFNQAGITYTDKGFVVIEKEMKGPLTESEVDSSTTPVTSLHTLQNYIESKPDIIIDWSTLL